ncbi:FlgD immunoglobulin-like domain containing protein [Calditrichota bacterium GD2]
MNSVVLSGLTFVVFLLSVPELVKGQTLTWLQGVVNNECQAWAVSADGNIVVGEAEVAGGSHHAVRWINGTVEDIGTLGGVWSRANCVTGDGQLVVGYASQANNDHRAFRWTTSDGLESLGTLGGAHSEAFGVSDDGAVVVGQAKSADNSSLAFRWENGVMQNLGTLGGPHSQAYGASADGSIVVGWARDSLNNWRAFRWENGHMQDLGTLGGANATALNISPDGSVIVGYADTSFSSARYHAFRWQEGKMEDLGTLGGHYSEAYAASMNGAVIVGWAEDSLFRWRAFRWYNKQMEDLNETYADLLNDGSTLQFAVDVSPDGRYICGWGWHARSYASKTAFLLDTGVSVKIDPKDDRPSPIAFKLLPNYPNPFNPATVISFQLKQASPVTLEIFDGQGKRIKTLLNKVMLPGKHVVRWNGSNHAGQPVAAGVYWYRLRAGDFSATRKMVLLK